MIPAARLKFLRRVRELGKLIGNHSQDAEALVKVVLYYWQKADYPHLAARMPQGCKDLIAQESVQQFAEWLRTQEIFNEAAYWLATAYAIWVGSETRTARSLFFTPPRLADRVISNLVNHGASLNDDHWHDPACGGAAFLVPIAQRMAESHLLSGKSPSESLKWIETKLSGSDLDETLIYLSQQFLLMALSPLIKQAGYQPSIVIRHTDGLAAKGPLGQYDVVACNPPYRKLKAHEVQKYADQYRDILEGQPNIYGLFIDRSLRLTRPGGHVGLLTPTSYLSGQYFSKLRANLLLRSNILQIDMLSNRSATFLNVEQETTVTTLRPCSTTNSAMTSTSVYVLEDSGEFASTGVYRLSNSGKPWAIPRAVNDANTLINAENSPFRLVDYGYIARIGSLVAYRDTRTRFKTKEKLTLGRIALPLVWATDISPSGNFIHGREQRISRSELFVAVDSINAAGISTLPSVLLQRLTSSDQSRRLVSAPIPKEWLATHSGFVCENHVIILEQHEDKGWSPEDFSKLLRTKVIDCVFRSISGASNVSIFELNALPLPCPSTLKKMWTDSKSQEELVTNAYQAVRFTPKNCAP
ncbi:Eco57I restriction-modification methylase domain-containing protein [Delftia sp. JD2]|uniref:Eco57I restriction-modification methylase domain-containing protein n=1 Tax=Delftia sp. JD2 TaxID=469553 RepID=UPI001112911E|nr:Eco57I restriction-modification methylase domain-containing protein [Delftia sp. JD2]